MRRRRRLASAGPGHVAPPRASTIGWLPTEGPRRLAGERRLAHDGHMTEAQCDVCGALGGFHLNPPHDGLTPVSVRIVEHIAAQMERGEFDDEALADAAGEDTPPRRVAGVRPFSATTPGRPKNRFACFAPDELALLGRSLTREAERLENLRHEDPMYRTAAEKAWPRPGRDDIRAVEKAIDNLECEILCAIGLCSCDDLCDIAEEDFGA